MKSVNAALTTSLTSTRAHFVLDVFALTLPAGPATTDGSVLRWTTAAVDVVYGGSTYDSARQAGAQGGDNARPVIRSSYSRLGDDLEVGQVELLMAGGGEVISSMTLPALALAGAFEGASLLVTRFLVSDFPTANPTTPDPTLALVLFSGYVDTVEPALETRLVVKSKVGRLSVAPVPVRNLQGLCPFRVYDANCQASKTGRSQSSSVASATRTSVTLTVDASWVGEQVIIYDATSGIYVGGTLASARIVNLGAAMPIPFPAGRSLQLLRACEKTRSACLNRFSNLVHFGGVSLVSNQGI